MQTIRCTVPKLVHCRNMSLLAKGSYTRSPLEVVRYGAGCMDSALPDILSQLGTSKAFILTGESLAKTKMYPKLVELLGSKHAGTNTDIGAHAPIAGIKSASQDLDTKGADTIIAYGGGSPIDSAKAIKYWRNKEGKGWIKIIAVPTTLSAAETTMNAGYTNEEGNKVGLAQFEVCPNAIIYDAEFTLETPEWLWLSSGMRAVDHAIETLYRADQPPPVIACALTSIPLLFKHLVASKTSPSSLPDREQLQVSAWLSLYPNPKPGAIGPSHGLGHALGATYQIGHGITSCITLAACIARVARHAAPEYLALMSEALKRLESTVPDLTPPTTRFNKPGDDALSLEAKDGVKLAGYVDALVNKLDLANRLRDYKVKKEEFGSILKAGHVEKDKDIPRAEMMEVLEEVW